MLREFHIPFWFRQRVEIRNHNLHRIHICFCLHDMRTTYDKLDMRVNGYLINVIASNVLGLTDEVLSMMCVRYRRENVINKVILCFRTILNMNYDKIAPRKIYWWTFTTLNQGCELVHVLKQNIPITNSEESYEFLTMYLSRRVWQRLGNLLRNCTFYIIMILFQMLSKWFPHYKIVFARYYYVKLKQKELIKWA